MSKKDSLIENKGSNRYSKWELKKQKEIKRNRNLVKSRTNSLKKRNRKEIGINFQNIIYLFTY